jgi:hypothetical protein
MRHEVVYVLNPGYIERTSQGDVEGDSGVDLSTPNQKACHMSRQPRQV